MIDRFATSALVLALALGVPAASADYYQFSGSLTNGYSVQGVFQTKATAPASFIESNPNFPNAPFLTQYIESASLSVSLLGSTVGVGSPVVGVRPAGAQPRRGLDAVLLHLERRRARWNGRRLRIHGVQPLPLRSERVGLHLPRFDGRAGRHGDPGAGERAGVRAAADGAAPEAVKVIAVPSGRPRAQLSRFGISLILSARSIARR
jgi:hypothetical protein